MLRMSFHYPGLPFVFFPFQFLLIGPFSSLSLPLSSPSPPLHFPFLHADLISEISDWSDVPLNRTSIDPLYKIWWSSIYSGLDPFYPAVSSTVKHTYVCMYCTYMC